MCFPTMIRLKYWTCQPDWETTRQPLSLGSPQVHLVFIFTYVWVKKIPCVLLAARPSREAPPVPILPTPTRFPLATPCPQRTLHLPPQLCDNVVLFGRRDTAQLAPECLTCQPGRLPVHPGLRDVEAPTIKTCHSRWAAWRWFFYQPIVEAGPKISLAISTMWEYLLSGDTAISICCWGVSARHSSGPAVNSKWFCEANLKWGKEKDPVPISVGDFQLWFHIIQFYCLYLYQALQSDFVLQKKIQTCAADCHCQEKSPHGQASPLLVFKA